MGNGAGRVTRSIALVGLAASALLSFTGCAGALMPSGDRIALDQVDATAEQVADRMTQGRTFSRDADWLAVTYLASSQTANDQPNETVTMDPLAWNGNSAEEPGAIIDVRIRVDVPGYQATSIGESSYEAGSAVKCVRYTVIGYRNYDQVAMERIDCPSGDAPPLPTPAPLPALPDDAADVLTAVMSNAAPATLESAVRAAFPEPFVTVDTLVVSASDRADLPAGTLIAAVGVPTERECIAAITVGETVEIRESFDPMWLEAGEAGCSVTLITNPPQ